MKPSANNTVTSRGAELAKSWGRKVRIARQARTFTQSELAMRARSSVPTIARMEAGQPGIALGIWLSVFEVLGMLSSLEALNDPMSEIAGRAALGRRVRHSKPAIDLDF